MTTTEVLEGLVPELARRIPYSTLAIELGVPEDVLRSALEKTGAEQPSPVVQKLLRRIMSTLAHEEGRVTLSKALGNTAPAAEELARRSIRTANKFGFLDLLPPHGITPVTYNIRKEFDLRAPPFGFDRPPPLVPLREDRCVIAGLPVDFPMGLPASVLAANSKWIEFYARRGFDILTYKTVRTVVRPEHKWPNWVFIQEPAEIQPEINKPLVGLPGYWPEDLATATMANSFGIPSFAPDWWEDDIRRARDVVREGHQILIVSVVSSCEPTALANRSQNDALTEIISDFIKAALRAKRAGADIIEANYSCPNVPGDEVGELFQSPARSARVSDELKGALGDTPLFVKIGYLTQPQLRAFVEANAPHIEGVVAINTMSAQVVDPNGKETFPGRPSAGISGWAIKPRAQEVAKNLVSLRNEIRGRSGKEFAILGLGGVLTEDHVREYMKLGVDAVESCTGAFLDPHLALKTRLDTDAMHGARRAKFELESLGRFVKDVIRYPTKPLRW